MLKHMKKFHLHSEYMYHMSNNPALPNVSICTDEYNDYDDEIGHIHYNDKYTIPFNTIKYYAPSMISKLDDGEMFGDGLHVISHEQIGPNTYRIKFDGPVTRIGRDDPYEDGPFAYSDLLNIVYPDTVESIGVYAFTGCNIQDFYITENIHSIGFAAFCECPNLSWIYIPENVWSISGGIFSNCTNLWDAEIRNDAISGGEFSGCENLENVFIGRDVYRIEADAFLGCENLTSITYDGTMEEWCNVSRVTSDSSLWHRGVPTDTVHCIDGDIWIDATSTEPQ